MSPSDCGLGQHSAMSPSMPVTMYIMITSIRHHVTGADVTIILDITPSWFGATSGGWTSKQAETDMDKLKTVSNVIWSILVSCNHSCYCQPIYPFISDMYLYDLTWQTNDNSDGSKIKTLE